MFEQQEAKLSTAARSHLSAYLKFLYTYRDSYFGNARTVRQLVLDVLRHHDLRRAGEGGKSAGTPLTVLKADVDHLKPDTRELSIQRKRIGF